MFTALSPAGTGIHFSNHITENDSIYIIDNEYIYNGGGVGIADFNKDGLQDIYFTGNMVRNRLYLNKGDFNFDKDGGLDLFIGGRVLPERYPAAAPVEAQMSSVSGMIADDVDGDSNLDLIINGNVCGIEIATVRYDAFQGLILKGDGKGGFKAMQHTQSGYYVPGDGKALVYLRSAKDDQPLLIASQNQGPLKVFRSSVSKKIIEAGKQDQAAIVQNKNGSKAKAEIYYVGSFYSQTGRYVTARPEATSVILTDINGKTRQINF